MKAGELFEQALNSFSQGKYPAAITELKKISHAETDPEGIYVDLATAFLKECHNLQVLKLLAEGRYREAASATDQSLTEFPGNQDLLFYKGIALNNSMNFPGAVRSLEAVYLLEPTRPAILACLGTALINLGNTERLEQLLQKALNLDARLCHLMAVARYRIKQYLESEEYLRRAVQQKPDFPDAQVELVAVYILLKRYTEAFQALMTALPSAKGKQELALPMSFLKFRGIGEWGRVELQRILALQSNQAVSEAEISHWADSVFYQTITIDVMTLPFMDSRGELIRQGWFRNLLIGLYQKMIVKGMDLPELYFRMGREFQRLNRQEEAKEYFRKCLGKNPNFLPAKISLGFACFDTNKLDEALPLFEEVQQDFNQMPEMLLKSSSNVLGETPINTVKEQLQAELSILLAASGPGSDYADLYYSIGRLYYLLEAPDKALSYFDKASILNPSFIRANIGKAITLMQLNQTDKAREILNTLTSSNALYAKIIYTLAMIHWKKEHFAKARKLFQELLTIGSGYTVKAREALSKLP